MPDILKVTTPLVSSNQAVSPKQKPEAVSPFPIQDTSRVIQTHNQSELLKQNTGSLENGDAPTLLMNLLRDPAVTVSYLKNIFLLEEIFKLVPANNKTVTQEIEQMFHELLLSPEELAEEMVRQEREATFFRGELYDFLRAAGQAGHQQPRLTQAIANLLKAISQTGGRQDILKAVVNNLTFLQASLPARDPSSRRLDALIEKLSSPGARENFALLKSDALALSKEIANSMFCTPKMQKVLSIMTYNLSRYNDNLAFLDDAALELRQSLPQPARQEFMRVFAEFLASPNQTLRAQPESKVMDALIGLLSRQVSQETESVSDAARNEKILHSLLSSPCNFTPLLHYILPAYADSFRAFAEVWIHTGSESDGQNRPGSEDGLHFLVVIDVEHVGRFEAEFFVRGRVIDFFLYCPPGLEGAYQPLISSFPSILSETEYRAGKASVRALQKTRSLMDVFKSLPYKRVGVDVKI